jgi:hypothetical protein
MINSCATGDSNPRIRSMRSVRDGVDWFTRSIDILNLLILVGGFYFIVDQVYKINISIKESELRIPAVVDSG